MDGYPHMENDAQKRGQIAKVNIFTRLWRLPQKSVIVYALKQRKVVCLLADPL